MRSSRPAVHPVEAPPPQPQGENADGAPVGVRMKDTQGGPGTPGGLGLRLVQVFFAAASLAAMASTDDFPSVTAFWCAETGSAPGSFFSEARQISVVGTIMYMDGCYAHMQTLARDFKVERMQWKM